MTKVINCHISDKASEHLDSFAAMIYMSRTKALTVLLELMNPGLTAASFFQGKAQQAIQHSEKGKTK